MSYAQKTVKVTANDLLQIPPYVKIHAVTSHDTCEMIYLLVDPTYANSISKPGQETPFDQEEARRQNMFPKIYHIDEMKALELSGIVKQIESAITIPHFYIKEIMRGLIYVSKASLTIAVIGDESKAEAIQNLLGEFGILELVRTGMVALERGQYTIDEQTKEKDEFDYGKNVL